MPAVALAAVPERTPVLLLSERPLGKLVPAPVTEIRLYPGVGLPVAEKVKDLLSPMVKVVLEALVKTGSVGFWKP